MCKVLTCQNIENMNQSHAIEPWKASNVPFVFSTVWALRCCCNRWTPGEDGTSLHWKRLFLQNPVKIMVFDVSKDGGANMEIRKLQRRFGFLHLDLVMCTHVNKNHYAKSVILQVFTWNSPTLLGAASPDIMSLIQSDAVATINPWNQSMCAACEFKLDLG